MISVLSVNCKFFAMVIFMMSEYCIVDVLMHIACHPTRCFQWKKHVSSQVVCEVSILPRHDAPVLNMVRICLSQINIRTEKC